jgi:hypothetical protein
MTATATELLVLRDAEGNYYLRVPGEQVAELEMSLGVGDVEGYNLSLYQPQPLFAVSSFRLSGVQMAPLSQFTVPHALNPWLA